MTGKLVYSSVPTSVELDNNFHGRKYTVNSSSSKVVIAKSLCVLLALGAILLAVLAALIVFLFVPKCSKGTLTNEALISDTPTLAEEIDPRLPTTLEPIYYSLDIEPDFQQTSVEGRVVISLKVNEETFEIIFNVRDIRIDKNTVTLRNAITNDTVGIESQDYISSERYKISTKESLKREKNYVLHIRYSTDFNPHLLGIYSSRYYEGDDKKTRSLVSTQFSPIDARRAFPCFDEPSFKSVFGLRIARPKDLNTISNMRQKGSPIPHKSKPNWVWDHFEDTPPIPTYLVAFVISDFKSASSSRPSSNLWATQSFLAQTKYASKLMPIMINWMEHFLNVSFPVEKLDLVAIPEFGFGAMENYGLITFRESMLLFDENNTSIEDQKSIAHVLAHELAHQWFGNLVTPKWWDDLWLKEGFATYFSYLAVGKAEPAWTYRQEMMSYEIHKALENDAFQSAKPISHKIQNNNHIRHMFGSASYSKGACLVRMMNGFLTKETFRKGLNYYLNKYKYKSADHKDLLKCFDDAAAEDSSPFVKFTNVAEIMENWINKPGFPMIDVKTEADNKTVTLKQKRYALDGEPEETKWWIPISFVTDLVPTFDNASTRAWLTGGDPISIQIDFKEWYVINVNQTGYYMVNYDENIWHSLIKNIMKVPALTRAQLIGDAMELAKANLLDYDIPLRLIANMAIRDKLIMLMPTLVAFQKLEYLSDMLVNTPAFGYFENYHKTIFKETYETVDFSSTVDEYLSLRIMKTVLEWSCRSTESRCAIMAHNIYRKWMQGAIVIQPNVRHIVYCTAIRQGGQAEWDFAYHQYLTTNSPTEKNVLLDALGCTKHEWLLSRYLDIVLDVDESYSMRIQDADRIFESIANNKAGSQLAFNFLRRNWVDLKQHLGEGFNILNKLILSLPRHMNTEFQLAELQKFKEELGHDIGSAAPAMDRAIEIVKTKVVWMQKNYDSLNKWFHAHKDNYGY